MDDENRLFISELTSNSFGVGSLGCIYDVAFPPPRFSSSSRRRCCWIHHSRRWLEINGSDCSDQDGDGAR